MNRLLTFSLVTAIAFTATAAPAQVNWSMATAYQDTNFHTLNIRKFAEEVQRDTDGKLNITVHSGGALLKMPEIKGGVETGQIQLGEILLSAYGSEDPFFEVDAIPFLTRGLRTAWEVYELSLPHVEARLASQGLLALFAVPWPGQGLYAQNPILSTSDFKGVKFRTYNAMTTRFAELISAAPITVQSTEIPEAFSTGRVSAMITSAATGVDTSAWDFTSHYYDVNAMNSKNMVIMNAAAFNELDADTQRVVLRAAAKAEVRGWIMSHETQAGLTARLENNGMVVEPPNPQFLAELEEIGKTMVDDWLAGAGERGTVFLKAYRLVPDIRSHAIEH